MPEIDLDYLIGVNECICDQVGEQCVIINENNLLSALSVQYWYDDPRLLASALIRSLTIAHGFRDANKRTAAIVGASICDFTCSEDEMAQCILDIAKGELRNVEEIADILYPES